jgi:hypothetical protein
LDFAESRWLFILAVEDVSTEYHGRWTMQGSMGGYAVVSGYLFNKQADGVRLVWRDRVVGRANSGTGSELIGRKEGVQLVESDYAIGQAAGYLLAKFETRHKRIESWAWAKVHTEIFDITCNVLWSALNDTLKNSGKYSTITLDDPDVMAVFVVGSGSKKDKDVGRIDYAILKGKENGCSMQVIETLHQTFRNDADALTKRVKESLSK